MVLRTGIAVQIGFDSSCIPRKNQRITRRPMELKSHSGPFSDIILLVVVQEQLTCTESLPCAQALILLILIYFILMVTIGNPVIMPSSQIRKLRHWGVTCLKLQKSKDSYSSNPMALTFNDSLCCQESWHLPLGLILKLSAWMALIPKSPYWFSSRYELLYLEIKVTVNQGGIESMFIIL